MADLANNAPGDEEWDDAEAGEEGEADVEEEGLNAAGVTVDDPLELLYKYHPETILDYAEAVEPKIPLQVAPPAHGGGEGTTTTATSDPAHTSPPFLTIYERTKILGTRANQIAEGARPFVTVPEYVTEPLEIAKLELEQRRLPFIIKRPMPDGTFEYWRLSDLMIL